MDKYNFEPETAVCINNENSDLSLILTLGVIFAGGFVVCTSHKDPYAEVLYVCKKVGPKFLLCSETRLNWAKQLELDLGNDQQVIGIAIDRHSDLFSYDHNMSRAFLTNKIPVPSDDLRKRIAFVTMSSGSTGRPKAVPVTQFTCLLDALTNPFCSDPLLVKGANIVYSSSLAHISGRIMQFGALVNGYNLVILAEYSPAVFLKLVEKYKVPCIHLGAGVLHSLINYKQLENYDISSIVRIGPIGSHIVYLEEFKRFLNMHKHIKFIGNLYGSSEIGIITTLLDQKPEDYFIDSRDCGRLLAGCQVKIVDMDSGKLLGKNQRGIIHAKSDMMFSGYYDYSASKTTPFVRGDFDSDGFFVSGDIGLIDDDERLHMFGRQKEVMVCRVGRKVVPQELEMILQEHQSVSSSSVIGIEATVEGGLHCPRAFVVPTRSYYSSARNGTEKSSSSSGEQSKLCSLPTELCRLLAQELLDFVNERVGWERQLTGGIAIIDEIPTLHTGKINKSRLREFGPNRVEIFGNKCEK